MVNASDVTTISLMNERRNARAGATSLDSMRPPSSDT